MKPSCSIFLLDLIVQLASVSVSLGTGQEFLKWVDAGNSFNEGQKGAIFFFFFSYLGGAFYVKHVFDQMKTLGISHFKQKKNYLFLSARFKCIAKILP